MLKAAATMKKDGGLLEDATDDASPAHAVGIAGNKPAAQRPKSEHDEYDRAGNAQPYRQLALIKLYPADYALKPLTAGIERLPCVLRYCHRPHLAALDASIKPQRMPTPLRGGLARALSPLP